MSLIYNQDPEHIMGESQKSLVGPDFLITAEHLTLALSAFSSLSCLQLALNCPKFLGL